ncbi:hypothetical protein F5X96DRAFT_600560 [Biscogniauxia mediterranea]|nr:hypothetical protein F5X96DRAFT_600560 [Biscogniauxia mediterranea]
MSELANRRKLFISHLSALGSDGSNQHAILPSPTMSFSPSPLLALLSRTSDYDLKQAYWHKPEVYKDNIGKYYIDTVWKRHLDFHGYTRSFQPLQGTERERYLPIIDRAHREEVDRIKNEELLLYRLSKATEVIEMVRKGQVTLEQPLPQPQVVDPPAPVKKKRGRPRKQPQPEDIQNGAPQPAPQSNQNSHVTGDHNVAPDRQPQAPPQYEESAKLIKAGIRELEEFIALRKPLRHARQYPEFAPFAFDTHYGCIIAKNQLHQGDWFMGHRPGDPIMRIVDAPRLHKIFGPDDAAHHPVFGREDFDIAQLYFRFRHEGIVPFNYSESQQRLEEHAFPAFLTMIIAALAFNPNKPEAEVPPPLSRIWTILAQDMASMDMNTKDELVRWMSVLQRIWKIKYGTDASKLPRFLKGQFAKSGSRLGEMAWLVCKVMSMSPGCHTLRCFVDWFLQAMVGANMQSVANWYLKYQLGREAQEQMQEGDIENIFFYRSNRPLEQVCVIFFFDFLFIPFPPV